MRCALQFALTPADFAPDRLRYNLRVGALLIFGPVRRPQPGDVCVATAHHRGRERRVLVPHRCPFFYALWFRRRGLELGKGDLEPSDVVIAHWLARHASWRHFPPETVKSTLKASP